MEARGVEGSVVVFHVHKKKDRKRMNYEVRGIQ